jgi:uncharacterized protein (TIGR03435 family)
MMLYSRTRFLIVMLLSIVVLGVPLCAQDAQKDAPSTSFEVASIRMVSDGQETVFPTFPAPQFTAENTSLTLLIAIAYGMSDNRIVGKPSWLDTTLYTVRAKPEGDASLTEKQYRPLMQDLLQRRFHLAVHFETREVSGYELVVAKGGSKLEITTKSDAMAYIYSNGLQSASLNTRTLASLLSRPLGHPVVDKTGLTDFYKLKLSFAPVEEPSSGLPDIFTAVQEQLGLKLESKKIPADFLVIDHVDKTPTEN